MTKAIIDFAYLSDAGLSTFTLSVLTKMSGNPNYTGTTASALVIQVQNDYDNYTAALSAAIQGGESAKIIKNTCKATLVNSLRSLCVFINFFTPNNADKISTTGFNTNKPGTPSILFPLKKLTLMSNDNVGSVTAKAVKGAGTKYLVMEHANGAALSSTTVWSMCADSKSTCTISGLQSGERVWIRVTSVGARNQTILCTPVSMIVP